MCGIEYYALHLLCRALKLGKLSFSAIHEPSQLSSNSASVRISTQRAGYAFGMRQPSVEMELVLDKPSHFELVVAQSCLSELFELAHEDAPLVRAFDEVQLDSQLLNLLGCTCGLARHLLQEGGVPVFAPEVILDARTPEAEPSRIRLHLRIPMIDHVPRGQVVAAYAHALSIMWTFTKPEDLREDPKPIADALYKDFIVPMRKVFERGLSTRPMFKEAFDRGIPFAHLSTGVFQLGTGAHSRLVAKSATDRDSALGAMISHRKDKTQVFLQDMGAPTADMILVRDAVAAQQAARRIGFPVVLKPADLDRSEGVFVDLHSDKSVRDAYAAASRLSSLIMVQRQIRGHCHRLVVFQGRFVFGFTRHPAAVVGDGVRSVSELVDRFNDIQLRKAKHLQAKPIPFDDEALSCLKHQQLGPDDIPGTGVLAFMRKANVAQYAGHNEIITDRVHPENIALAERVSRMFRLESVGIDFISNDPSRPWHETGAAITELNFQPQIGENTARANLAAMFPNGTHGTIPVICFVGGKAAMKAGRKYFDEIRKKGIKAALTSHDTTIGSDGAIYQLDVGKGLSPRCTALLQDPSIAALVVVVQTTEFNISGPPFQGNVTVTHVDSDVHRSTDPSEWVNAEAVSELIRVLKGY